MEEKDVVDEEENEDMDEAASIAGSVDWRREREVDMVDCDARGVSTKGSPVP
jgi:hypothetical protein